MTNFQCNRCATTYVGSKPRQSTHFAHNDCPICGAGQDAIR